VARRPYADPEELPLVVAAALQQPSDGLRDLGDHPFRLLMDMIVERRGIKKAPVHRHKPNRELGSADIDSAEDLSLQSAPSLRELPCRRSRAYRPLVRGQKARSPATIILS